MDNVILDQSALFSGLEFTTHMDKHIVLCMWGGVGWGGVGG